MRDYITKVNDTAPLTTGKLDAQEFNSFASELENAVTASGLTLDAANGPDSDLQMLAQSMTRHASGALWVTDSGVANAYVVAMAGDFIPPGALFDGLCIRFYPGNANSGASTCNAFGLGAKAIVNHLDAPLASGSIDGRMIELIYDSSIGAGSWVLPAWANALYVAITPIDPATVTSGEGVEVDLSNEVNLNFSGLVNDASPADADIFAFFDVSEGVHNGITKAQLAALFAGGNSGGLVGVQLITASGTYTKTEGTNSALVFATGGGGGGAAGNGEAEGGGGGGGATAIAFVDLSGVPTVACTIGAGGAGGVASNGSAGGSTAFGAHASAGGGSGGIRSSTAVQTGRGVGGAGGSGTTGLMLLGGGNGEGAVENGSIGGEGGASFWGAGGAGQWTQASQAAQTGRAYGAGGGGGGNNAGGVSNNGAAGASGCILVLEFA